MGQVFVRDNLDSPFSKVDEILEKFKDVHFIAKVVDFHAEATSEKRAMGYYLDGRVSALVGTHTHVQTSDNYILPKGTAYMTDIGMVGTIESILGETIESVLDHYIQRTPHRYTLEENGDMAIHGALVSVGKEGKATDIKKIRVEVAE